MARPKPGPLAPPDAGVTVRMYRQGHGDCFLLCARKEDGSPFYMVIDCGLWPGSECDAKVTMKEVVADIAASTSGRLDVLAITHEHMDHVSGFASPKGAAEGSFHWDAIEVGELWLAWTEDARDPDAIALRERFDDVLLGLAAVAGEPDAFGLDGSGDQVHLIRDVLALHTGEADFVRLAEAARDRRNGLAADGGAPDVAGVSNKVAIRRMRGAAGRVRFLSPGNDAYDLPGMGGSLRAYALGPPRDPSLLLSLDPKGPEEFKFRLDGASASLLAALVPAGDGAARAGNPFSPRFGAPPGRLRDADDADFFADHYGDPSDRSRAQAWRAIDGDWAGTAESLALRLNDEVNNTSLVLAFELPRSGKVLLFTGDAQRGSWISWGGLEWMVDGRRVTARDLLARTVLYKVGHHGSHNATLNGRAVDGFANLEWLGQRGFADEFVAFIPANKKWADAKRPKPWKHPLKAIEGRLNEKAAGRVFRTDLVALPKRPPGASAASWDRFTGNAVVTKLYCQYTLGEN